jgi:hypothetical protein
MAQILESLLRIEDPQTLVADLVATHGNQRFLRQRPGARIVATSSEIRIEYEIP